MRDQGWTELTAISFEGFIDHQSFIECETHGEVGQRTASEGDPAALGLSKQLWTWLYAWFLNCCRVLGSDHLLSLHKSRALL